MFLFFDRHLIGALRTEKVLLMVVRDVCPIDPTVFCHVHDLSIAGSIPTTSVATHYIATHCR